MERALVLPLSNDKLRLESTQDILLQTAFECLDNSSAIKFLKLDLARCSIPYFKDSTALIYSQLSYLASKRFGIGPALFAADVLGLKIRFESDKVVNLTCPLYKTRIHIKLSTDLEYI